MQKEIKKTAEEWQKEDWENGIVYTTNFWLDFSKIVTREEFEREFMSHSNV